MITSDWCGYVANQDIPCYIFLFKENGKYRTFNSPKEIVLNSENIGSRPIMRPYRGKYHFYDGVIFACTGYEPLDIKYYMSFIPKGTRFWISDDLLLFATEKLYVTDMLTNKIDFSPYPDFDLEFPYSLCNKEFVFTVDAVIDTLQRLPSINMSLACEDKPILINESFKAIDDYDNFVTVKLSRESITIHDYVSQGQGSCPFLSTGWQQ